MNKVKAILLLVFICMLLLTAGCGKDDDNPAAPENNVPAELVGMWLYESATLNGVPFGLGLLLGWEPGTVAARFTVGSDRSFLYEELDADSAVVWTEWGTFTVDGNTATITRTENDAGPMNPPEIMSGTWTLSGDTLVLTTSYEGLTVVLTAVRYQL
ncbi:MAG: hypothetical protein JSU85_00190 [Candidatus Zixiibacteriota bacterium]|nr:MAG: hypothetical protein JSU85_00190 [candidate division Zixibacteria bacterium]